MLKPDLMYRIILGNIGVDFSVINQMPIKYSAFVKHLRIKRE
jgi:hypothetical protein